VDDAATAHRARYVATLGAARSGALARHHPKGAKIQKSKRKKTTYWQIWGGSKWVHLAMFIGDDMGPGPTTRVKKLANVPTWNHPHYHRTFSAEQTKKAGKFQ
jgi:hypothetical protein